MVVPLMPPPLAAAPSAAGAAGDPFDNPHGQAATGMSNLADAAQLAAAEHVAAGGQAPAGADGQPPAAADQLPPNPPEVAVPDLTPEVLFSDTLAKVIEDNGLGEVFTALGPILYEIYGTAMITHGMIINHRVRVTDASGVSKNVTLSLVHGEDRQDAITAWVLELMPRLIAARQGRATPTSYAVSTTLYTVLSVLAPDRSKEPSRRSSSSDLGRGRTSIDDDELGDGRDTSPAGCTRSAMARAEATEKAKDSLNEMSRKEIRDRCTYLQGKPGKAPTLSNICHANQLKRLHQELVVLKQVPCGPNTQPHTMLSMAGESGLLADKAERGKDVIADATTSALELRARLRLFCTSVRLVTCYEDDAEETSRGVETFTDAMDDCRNLVTYAQARPACRVGGAPRARGVCSTSLLSRPASVNTQVYGAVVGAMNKARRSSTRSGATLHEAFSAAADIIYQDNDQAMKQALLKKRAGDKDPPGEDDDEDEAGAATNPKKKRTRKRAKNNDPDGKAVTLPNGLTKKFKAYPGGNRDCPVKCTKAHGKTAVCEYNHSDKQ